MGATQSTASDRKYINWITGTLSLLYMKEGIEKIIDTEAVCFHINLQQTLSGKGLSQKVCSSCTSRSMKKDYRGQVWYMSCVLCDPWLKNIVLNHIYHPLPNLSPENTNPQLWRTVPFEVFKAFMPYGCQGIMSAKDGDIQGILSLIQNCLHFRTCGRIGQINLVDKLLEFRNSLFHSGNFLVEDADLQVAQQTMLSFLGGMAGLSHVEQQSVNNAVTKIKELQKGTLHKTLDRDLELLALQQKQNALDSSLHRVQHEIELIKAKASSTEDDVNINLGISKRNIAKLDTSVETLQKDYASVLARTATAEVGVNTLTDQMTDVQKSLQKEYAELQAVQSSFNIFLKKNHLEQDMTRLSRAHEDHDKRIQSLETQTQQHAGEIATLYQRQVAAAAELDAQKNILEVQKSRQENVEARLHKQLQAVQSSFNIFLKKNHLEQDMTRLSRAHEDHDKRIQSLETQTQQHAGEIATLYQRQVAAAAELDAQKNTLEVQKSRQENVEARLHKQLQAVQSSFNIFLKKNHLEQDMTRLSRAHVDHDKRIQSLETQTQAGIENKEISDTDITVAKGPLKQELRDLQRQGVVNNLSAEKMTIALNSVIPNKDVDDDITETKSEVQSMYQEADISNTSYTTIATSKEYHVWWNIPPDRAQTAVSELNNEDYPSSAGPPAMRYKNESGRRKCFSDVTDCGIRVK